MQFGIFDHLDYRNETPAQSYSDRITLIRAAEQAGFRRYHLAEHHGTPLGMAPSPGIFLAALARETKHIRLGPMVYCLPLYVPLRLLEEICMLDQLSGGRIEIGVGRGASPIESAFYGVTREESVPRYVEVMEILRAGLASDRLSFRGTFYRYDDVPLPLRPVQPQIPFWSAALTPEARAHAAAGGMHLMVLGASERVKEAAAHYRAIWRAGDGRDPLIGAYRMVFVADNDTAAEARARPAFDLWFSHLAKLWREHNETTPFLSIESYDRARDCGMLIAGSPGRVRDELAAQVEACGYNYAVLQLAFGSLGHAAEMRSLALFAERVMPDFPG